MRLDFLDWIEVLFFKSAMWNVERDYKIPKKREKKNQCLACKGLRAEK